MRHILAVMAILAASTEVYAQHSCRVIDAGAGATAGQGGAAAEVGYCAAGGPDGMVWLVSENRLRKYPSVGGMPLIDVPIVCRIGTCDVDDTGNVYVGAWGDPATSPTHSRVSKYDASGNVIWTAAMFGAHSLRVRCTSGGVCHVAWQTKVTSISSSGNPIGTVELRQSPTTLVVDRQTGAVGAGRFFVSGGSVISATHQSRHIVAMGGGVAWVTSAVGPGPLERWNSVSGAFANTVNANHLGSADGIGFGDGSAVLVDHGRTTVRKVTPAGGFPWSAIYGRSFAGGAVPALSISVAGSNVVLAGAQAAD